MRRPTFHNVSTLDQFSLVLPALQRNRLNEPEARNVAVWYPAECDTKGLPLLICLASYLNSGPSLTAWRNFGENLPERLDRLYETGQLEPCLVVFIDSYNRLGGTQFVNSPIIGHWMDALGDELVPAIEARYGCGGAGRRGLFGHSSGGYGALYNLTHRPDIWSAAASHAGDCGFDLVYRSDLPKALRVLSAYDFNPQAFLEAFWQQEKPKGEQIPALMMLAMAASYDPIITSGSDLDIRLPVTHHTCQLIQERWANWLAFDPLVFIPEKMASLKTSKGVYVDCGRQDEYNILYGTRAICDAMMKHDVHGRFEEFDGGHGTIGPRYEVSIPWLVSVLASGEGHI